MRAVLLARVRPHWKLQPVRKAVQVQRHCRWYPYLVFLHMLYALESARIIKSVIVKVFRGWKGDCRSCLCLECSLGIVHNWWYPARRYISMPSSRCCSQLFLNVLHIPSAVAVLSAWMRDGSSSLSIESAFDTRHRWGRRKVLPLWIWLRRGPGCQTDANILAGGLVWFFNSHFLGNSPVSLRHVTSEGHPMRVWTILSNREDQKMRSKGRFKWV